MDKTIVLKPRLSEKSYGLSQKHNTYVIDVSGDVNKHSVARAVAAQFDVVVTKVNIANIDGKAARVVSKGGRRVSKGHRSDVKKAYVTLAEGSTVSYTHLTLPKKLTPKKPSKPKKLKQKPRRQTRRRRSNGC